VIRVARFLLFDHPNLLVLCGIWDGAAFYVFDLDRAATVFTLSQVCSVYEDESINRQDSFQSVRLPAPSSGPAHSLVISAS